MLRHILFSAWCTYSLEAILLGPRYDNGVIRFLSEKPFVVLCSNIVVFQKTKRTRDLLLWYVLHKTQFYNFWRKATGLFGILFTQAWFCCQSWYRSYVWSHMVRTTSVARRVWFPPRDYVYLSMLCIVLTLFSTTNTNSAKLMFMGPINIV